MITFEESDDLSFGKIFETDGAVFIRVSNFHFFDLVDFESHSIELFLKVILLEFELYGVFDDEFMELEWGHAIDGRLDGGILVVVVAFDDSFVLVLVVNEV